MIVALECLAGSGRDYLEAANSANTRRAYASDWKRFASYAAGKASKSSHQIRKSRNLDCVGRIIRRYA